MCMGRTLEDTGALEAYETLAPDYDSFTSHHDYAFWTAEIRALARTHGVEGGRMLDVGCGTGKSFLPFLEEGWHVTGCDVSPSMIELAAAKAPGVALHVCD